MLTLTCIMTAAYHDHAQTDDINPLMGTLIKIAEQRTTINTLIGALPLMGGLLHLIQRREAWRHLLAVPNVTAHPSTASVPTSY